MGNCTRLLSGLCLAFWAICLPAGCHKVVETSPYSSDVPSRYQHLNTEVNKMRLGELPPDKPLRIAFIADTHYSHKELGDAIRSINGDSSIGFVIFCGDYSDQGLLQEYLLFYDELKKLSKPFFTVIGNHEHLANAAGIYAQMFGPANYVVDLHFIRLIFFDDCFWESGAIPDFDWLEARLAASDGRIPVVVAHIPPYGDQFDAGSRSRYERLMQDYGVTLSVHGHIHKHDLEQKGPTTYLAVPSVNSRQYCTSGLMPGNHAPDLSLINF